MLYFLKFKDLTCNFCAFSHFLFYFSVSFYSIWIKIIWKFRKNVGLHAYRLGSVLNRSWTGLRTAIFSGLSQKFWEDWDCWSAWTGYSPVRFSVPFRSYEPVLEALLSAVVFFIIIIRALGPYWEWKTGVFLAFCLTLCRFLRCSFLIFVLTAREILCLFKGAFPHALDIIAISASSWAKRGYALV